MALGYSNRYLLGLGPMRAGVERLWHEIGEVGLTIAGQTVLPSCWFDGTGLDPVAKTWTCRQTGTVLSLAGAGTEPTFDAESPVLAEKACKGNAGQYLQPPDSAFCDITTEDFVLVTIYQFNTDGAGVVVDKRDGAGAAFVLRRDSANVLGWWIEDSAGHSANALCATTSTGAWAATVGVFDRSGSGIVYTNAVAGVAVDISAVLSMTVADRLCFFARPSGAASDHGLALFALFKKAAWLDSHLQPALAARLQGLLTGTSALFQSDGILTPNEEASRVIYVGEEWF